MLLLKILFKEIKEVSAIFPLNGLYCVVPFANTFLPVCMADCTLNLAINFANFLFFIFDTNTLGLMLIL